MQPELDKTIESLHPLERKILPLLVKHRTAAEICKASGLSETEVLRALQWLSNKQLAETSESHTELVWLDTNGEKYAKQGMPERRFLEAAENHKGIDEIRKAAGLEEDELSICLGMLRKNCAIELKNREVLITPHGKKLLQGPMPAEEFLRRRFPAETGKLGPTQQKALAELRQRKAIVKVTKARQVNVQLTKPGLEALRRGIREGMEEKLTPQMLKTGSWKGKEFRRYDLLSAVPKIYGGKKQHYRRFLEEVRDQFIALGFEEMTGPIVETEFWNMDSLYMPQFHSARDIHDAYYIKEPKYSKELPGEIVEKVRQAHERGAGGSKGWRYRFDVQRTHRHVLRTQDTSISPRTLSSPKLKIPGKYFQMVRCFRYDVIDATHLADFNQIGGFVVEEGINFRHLIGLLKLFAEEFAKAEQIKVVPAYFPFTEPSAALYAKHPEMGWIELGGSGIFRPEMTHPLGVKAPVIAWGLGVDRLAMFKLGIKDIRQLFSHDLEFLRNVKVI